MTDHAWDAPLQVHAHLGHPGKVRCYEVFAEDPLAVAITGQICALSIETGSGRKFRVGPLWWKRIEENAVEIERAAEEL